MNTGRRGVAERIAIVAGFVGGGVLIAAITLLVTNAPIVLAAVCLPVGFVILLVGIGLTLYLRRGVAGDTWPRSGRATSR